MLRRLTAPVATLGGLVTAGIVDRALTPGVKPLTTAATSTLNTVGPIRLYQYEICPFCNKIKALLDLYRVPYETLEVNPLTKKEYKDIGSDYRKVPVAMLGEEQVNDSAVIAKVLLERIGAAGVVPAAELKHFSSPSALEWAEWSDKKFSVLLFPNITRSFSESFEAFAYVMQVPHFSLLDKVSNQFVGAFFMWLAQGKIKKKYFIDDERAALHAGIHEWLRDGVGDKPFAGGDKPNLADISVFGALKAIDRTAAHKEILAETSISPWYNRVKALVDPGNSCTLRQ
mmetsp:Transcript_39368/g.90437  ORF Transcript_39368/g.90437 Transcript_39368/m.90437 type:complete len:286 (+) Transcript_39368:20-877(+)